MSHRIGPREFAITVGASESALPETTQSILTESDLSYRPFAPGETSRIVHEIVTKLVSGELSDSGPERHGVWTLAWDDILQKFRSSGFDYESLIPDFYPPTDTARFGYGFVHPESDTFHLDFLNAFRSWIFSEYLGSVETIYEFASGSGHNLVELNKLFPKKSIVGLDWAESSRDIANLIGEHHRAPITGKLFDFFNPDPDLQFDGNSGVLTMGGIEQVGDSHRAFLDFLLIRKPAICVNIEPLVELYDEKFLLDHLGASYSRSRKYLNGYLPRLEALASDGVLEIIKQHHVRFGGTYHDGWSYVVWRPVT